MGEDGLYFSLVAGPTLAIALTRKIRTPWYRMGTLVLGIIWISAVLVIWNLDARCSGSLIFGYRSCRQFDDETAQIVSLSAAALVPFVGLIWAISTLVFLSRVILEYWSRSDGS